jgi:hypothetical protein
MAIGIENFNLAGYILIFLIIVGLYILTRNPAFENFIVFLDDVIIPKTCPDYLVYNGSHYFLFNSKLTFDGVSNPMKFSTKSQAMDYLSKVKCPQNIPFVDLVQRKKTEDVSVSYERECNRKVAPNLFDLDICSTYGSDYDTLTGSYLARINKIQSDRKLYADYDTETCMINKAVNENPELDDSKFIQQFKTYFDRLNSNIDEQYLYITGR